MNPHIFLLRAAVLAAGLQAFLFQEACAADSPRPEISFVVHKLTEKNAEGPDMERTYFMAAGKRIVFGLPKGCQLSVGDGFLLLLNDIGLNGEIHVRSSRFTPEMDLAANALQYRDAAAKDVPTDAMGLVVQQPLMNPYPYNGWKSLGFTCSYSAYGRPMVRTVSYINLEMGVQIVVTTLAVKSDAEKVDKIAKQFISSWWVMGG